MTDALAFAATNAPAAWLILFAAGALVSLVNSVSGGGSVLSLPLLMGMGLPAAEANGTNRLGVWFGSLGSTAAFRRSGIFYPRLILRVGVPGLIGSLFGALAGVFLPDSYFRPVLGVAIAWIVFETLRSRGKAASGPKQGVEGEEAPHASVPALPVLPNLRSGVLPFLAYAAVGFYGGLLQAGVGLVMMYTFTKLGSLTLLQANALKVANNLFFATLSVAVFALFGKIRWDWALVFAAGNLCGGVAGSVLQVKRGESFIRGFVAVTGSLVALKLMGDAFRSFLD
jgi:uncharacterized membrane protein YfcA